MASVKGGICAFAGARVGCAGEVEEEGIVAEEREKKNPFGGIK